MFALVAGNWSPLMQLSESGHWRGAASLEQGPASTRPAVNRDKPWIVLIHNIQIQFYVSVYLNLFHTCFHPVPINPIPVSQSRPFSWFRTLRCFLGLWLTRNWELGRGLVSFSQYPGSGCHFRDKSRTSLSVFLLYYTKGTLNNIQRRKKLLGLQNKMWCESNFWPS